MLRSFLVTRLRSSMLRSSHVRQPPDARRLDDVVGPTVVATVADGRRKADLSVVAEAPPGGAKRRNNLTVTSTAAKVGDDVVDTTDIENARVKPCREDVDELVVHLMVAAHLVSSTMALSLTG